MRALSERQKTILIAVMVRYMMGLRLGYRVNNPLYLFPEQARLSGSGDAAALKALWRKGLAARVSDRGYETKITRRGIHYCIEEAPELADEVGEQLDRRGEHSNSLVLWAMANEDGKPE